MSKTAPKLLSPPVKSFTVDFEGYNFYRGRWEGEENREKAEAVAKQFNKAGYTSAVFENKDKAWHKNKYQDFVYYKVWVCHPKMKILYVWWEPDDKDCDLTFPLKFDHPTWFEFEQPKVETKA